MQYRNNGASEEHIIQNRFTAYLLVALRRKKNEFLALRFSHQQHEQPNEPGTSTFVSICDVEDTVAELANEFQMGYKGVVSIYYRTIQRIKKELEERR